MKTEEKTVPAAETSLPPNPKTEMVPMTIGKAKLDVEIRDSQEERELGLSYRETMAKDEGMAFVFDGAAPYGFWMLGMQFPLDMIWIRGGKVVDISQNVPPPQSGISGEPEARAPKEAVDTVIEVNAGWVEKNGIKIGDNVGANNYSP
jgi:hypothetical protein